MPGALGVNAVRLAEATMCANGGFQVLLRMPGLAAAGDAEQMGLATPLFQDEPVGPAVWRKAGDDSALLVGSRCIAELVGSQGYASAEAMFEAAAGVVVDGVFYTIMNSQPIVVGGVPCGYRLSVVGPERS